MTTTTTTFNRSAVIPIGDEGDCYLHPDHLAFGDAFPFLRAVYEMYDFDIVYALHDFTVEHVWCIVEDIPEDDDRYDDCEKIYRFVGEGTPKAEPYTALYDKAQYSMPPPFKLREGAFGPEKLAAIHRGFEVWVYDHRNAKKGYLPSDGFSFQYEPRFVVGTLLMSSDGKFPTEREAIRNARKRIDSAYELANRLIAMEKKS